MEIYIIREDGYHYGGISHSNIVSAHKTEEDAIEHLSDGVDTDFYTVARITSKDGHKAVVHSTLILGGSCNTVPTYSVARYIVPVNLT